MNFTKGDINKIAQTPEAAKVELTSGDFYAKMAFDANASSQKLESLTLATNELIYTSLAKRLGLICPEVYLVMPNALDESEVFIVSENLNCFGQFQTMAELGMKRTTSSSLGEIEDFLNQKYALTAYSSQIPNLMTEIIKLYFLDIFLSSWDRLPRNFGILKIDNALNLAIFDNEYAFTNFVHNISASSNGNSWWERRKFLDKIKNSQELENERLALIKEDLLNFFASPYKEYYPIFEEMYNFFTPEFLARELLALEQEKVIATPKGPIKLEIPDKDIILADYQKNYDLLTEVKRSLNYGRK